jgi:hypothetical protein
MRPEIFLRLSQHRSYWRARDFLDHSRFLVLKRVFGLRYFGQEEHANASLLLGLVRLTIPQLLAALAISCGVQILELILVPRLVDLWTLPDPQIYSSWLVASAQIGAFFVALYFTAVTAAAGAIYAKVPNNIRNLLAHDRVGNTYIRYLIFATFIPLCFVALQMFGFEPLRLAVPLLVIAEGVGIIAFAKLGQRAFYLFDPTSLSDSVFAELNRWTSQVSAGGFRWLDNAFQNHAHRQAASLLETADTLSDMAANNASLDGRPLLELTDRILLFLAAYQRRKLGVPTDSLWFEHKYEHKDWYLTADSTVQIAYQTGTSLQPSSISDRNWVEKRLEFAPIRCFEVNARAHRSGNIQELIESLRVYVSALAAAGQSGYATELVEKFQAALQKLRADSAGNATALDIAANVGIEDTLGYLQIEVLVSYWKALDERIGSIVRKQLQKVDWRKPKSIYERGFQFEELQQLEWLSSRIQFEIAVEGRPVTALWYQQHSYPKPKPRRLLRTSMG